jgi:hypothetical protein
VSTARAPFDRLRSISMSSDGKVLGERGGSYNTIGLATIRPSKILGASVLKESLIADEVAIHDVETGPCPM